MNKNTKDNKTHIGIYGRRNMGKSSIINSIAEQDIAIVSDIAGTTTDPVKKSFEIIDYAPVILIDTAGIDDHGSLGEKRIEKSYHSISSVDLGIIVITNNSFEHYEDKLVNEFKNFKTPFIILHNKSDLQGLDSKFKKQLEEKYNTQVIEYSTKNPDNSGLIEAIKKNAPDASKAHSTIIGDLLKTDDIIMLICPIDSEAPVGRMILPQVQLIRDILDNYCTSIVIQPEQVERFLKTTKIIPSLVITDSQFFEKADKLIPKEIPLTSFSTILARFKGDFEEYIQGTPYLDKLENGDKVLILEACSHHISCEDIARHKLPLWLKKHTGKDLEFDVVAGLSKIKTPITDYSIIIQCGGCMITKKQLSNRLLPAIQAGIPVTNYGLAIAYIHGIFERAVAPFKQQ